MGSVTKKVDAVRLKQIFGVFDDVGKNGKNLFKVTFQKMHHDKNKVLVEMLTKTGKANGEIYLASIKDLKHYTAASKIFAGRLTGKLSNAIGAKAEHYVKQAVRKGRINNPKAPPATLSFDTSTIMSVQNKSGHGLDLMAKNSPPPSPPRWYVFECKSTLGGKTVPGLSAKQKKTEQYLTDKLNSAKNGIKNKSNTWSDKTAADKRLYEKILRETEIDPAVFIKADVYMDHAGALTGKKINFTDWK